MESLHDVFDALAGQPDRSASEMLHDAGYGDLPPELVGDALVNYADTAPVEVAEHLAPFVTAHTTDAAPDLDAGLGLLSGALSVAADLDSDLADLDGELARPDGGLADLDSDLDFGAGGDTADVFDAAEAFADDVDTTVSEPVPGGHLSTDDHPGNVHLSTDDVDFGAGVGEAPDADTLDDFDADDTSGG